MATNLTIDEKLLEKAKKLGKHKSKKEAVNIALAEYIRRFEQQEILSLFGKIEYEKDFDYKKQRNRK